ncbi:MAG: IS4 family transposase [Lunatimonas sp.]|uniref:IS4 family transposase n=1 Tax=Lunatimonas sp. TaxID=2060141 RepID=UPI00263ADC0B|nr:IS4 family transposase [Lunatimonas sp.]MCC5938254.1 IS4 family transposase [Lunatimonas sp.]
MKQGKHNFLSGHPIIAQLLSLIPKEIFDDVVEQQGADRYYKKLKMKDHFICMFYAVLTRNGSLREVCKNIGLIILKLIPLGMKQLPARSPLSDANRRRDHRIFSTLYFRLFMYYKTSLGSNWLDIGGEVDPGRVEVFDSTTVTLFKDILKGAGRNPIEGDKKGGVKIFAKMNLAEGVPNFICIRPAATNENMFLKVMELPEYGIAVFDKGYNRYASFEKWDSSNRYFVTRKKDNARYAVVRDFDCSHSEDIVKDQLISLGYRDKCGSRTVEVRLVTYIDPESGEVLEFITNLKGLDALTIALLYKNRWVIEVLFKQIKQNFELKYFLSDSENGIKIQIWVALILNLLFTVLHKRIREAEDFSTMVMVAAKNLSSYVSLEKFLLYSEAYFKTIFQKDLQKVQTELFLSG